MSRRIGQLDTWVQGKPTGRAACSPEDVWTYSYFPDAHADVALSMPRDQVVYTHRGILPPFEQHLPEMDLGLFPAALWKLVRRDDMGLLLIAGNRRLGRVSYAEPGQQPQASAGLRLSEADFRSIPDGEQFLLDHLAKLAFVPGVSGIQPKTLAILQVAELEPARAHIDTHILKGNRAEYPWATVVEYACLQAARSGGLEVPEAELSGDGRLLAVRRFDLTPDGLAARGLDEACSLLGLFARDKYTGSYERMWKSLRPFIAPARRGEDALRFFKHLAFCHAIENGDAHLKNFGLIYDLPEEARLAPAYDLLTTTCFPSLRRDFPALTLAGRRVWDCVPALLAFARKVLMISDAAARRSLAEIGEGMEAQRPLLRELGQQHPEAGPVLEATEEAWARGLARLRTAYRG